MDRNRRQRIKKYVCLYAVFACLFLAFLSVLSHDEMSRERYRMLTLLAGHPELEAELISLWEKPEHADVDVNEKELLNAIDTVQNRYGYDLEKNHIKKRYVCFGGAGLFAGLVFAVCAAYFESRREKRGSDSAEMLRGLQEYVNELQKGNFPGIPDYGRASGEWMKLWESVRELGVYFGNLKLRLLQEEESTKRLITDISHQLKTPLASLRMSHELVMSGTVTEEEKQEFEAQEKKEIEKLELLLNELVNLSRLEKHVIELHPVPAGIRETITEAVSRVYMRAREKEIELQAELERDMLVCHDVKWTVEALINVLDNAVKYSDNGACVTIRAHALVKHVLIEIEDEGMGIRPDELANIYQRFYRGSEAKQKVKEGAGVGLYLSRLIFERQGGTISAKRVAEKGTVFRMTLPLVK